MFTSFGHRALWVDGRGKAYHVRSFFPNQQLNLSSAVMVKRSNCITSIMLSVVIICVFPEFIVTPYVTYTLLLYIL